MSQISSNIVVTPFALKYQQMLSYSFLIIAAFLFFNIDNDTWIIIKSAIADAYINVTSFVAGTLLIFFFLEKFFNIDLNRLLHNRPKLEILVSSGLGALPGCGGAIIVLTQYSRGKISFGSVVATLTATMGDAAFLLIAKDPKMGFLIMIIGFFVGFISGVLVNKIHGKNFMKMNGCDIIRLSSKTSDYKASKTLDIFWIIFLIPGIILGVLSAFQINLEEYFVNSIIEDPITFFGFLAGTLCLIMWVIPLISGLKYSPSKPDQPILRRTVVDTNFITTWVVLAFLTVSVFLTFSNRAREPPARLQAASEASHCHANSNAAPRPPRRRHRSHRRRSALRYE